MNKINKMKFLKGTFVLNYYYYDQANEIEMQLSLILGFTPPV